MIHHIKTILFLSFLFLSYNSSFAQDYWTTTSAHPFNIEEKFSADSAGNLYCADSVLYKKRIYKSTNTGITWKIIYTLPDDYQYQRFNGFSVTPDGKIFIGTDTAGFLYSTNGGANWKFTGNLQSGQRYYSVTKLSNGNLIGVGSSKLFRSTNAGVNWTETGNGIVVQDGGTVYAAQSGALLYGNGGSLFRSTDNGENWLTVSIAGGNYCRMRGGSGNSFITHAFPGIGSNIYYTTDAGLNWQISNFPSSSTIPNLSYSSNGINHFIYARDSLFKSSNGGATFQFLPNSIQYATHIKGDRAGNMFIYFDDPDIGMYRSTNSGANWNYIVDGVAAASNISKLLFDVSGRLYAFNGHPNDIKAYISANSGDLWMPVYPPENLFASVKDSSGVYAVSNLNSAHSYVVRTTDGGINWTQVGSDVPFFGDDAKDLIVKGNIMIIATIYHGVYRSTNGGNTWDNLNNGIANNIDAERLLKTSSGNIILGASLTPTSSGIYTSTNNGDQWSSTMTLSTEQIEGFYQYQTSIYCYTRKAGIYKSTNNGMNWTKLITDMPDGADITSMAINSLGNIFASVLPTTINGNFYGGVYRSINAGTNFYQVNSGLADAYVNSLAIDNNGFLFGGTKYFGVVKTRLSTTVGIQQISTIVPENFELKQNYPNPFNPETKINYNIRSRSFVDLKVFDITGREVAALVNSVQEPGEYSYTFSGAGLSSGLYFYRLSAGEFMNVKKMLLVK